MATFKAGQRVRVVAIHIPGIDAHLVRPAVGMVGTVMSIWERRVNVLVTLDSGPLNAEGKPIWFFASSELAPLTDPKADEFIEGLKKLTYVEPEAPKVNQPERVA
jgi:hypothetical protein